MKIYIQSMMAFAAIVSFASCSSEDNVASEMEGVAKVMTFTATQEEDKASTKAVLDNNGTSINWETGDAISLLYGSENKQLTLNEGAGTTSAKFTGETEQSSSYTAVYPYQENASLSGIDVTNVILPATQTATANSFDRSAALMVAQSTNTTLSFKNAVGYVKVKPQFNCSKIELKAADEEVALAGKGTLKWNDGNPIIEFTSNQSYSITLEGTINADTDYYIAVPAAKLKRMWSISFTTSDGSNVYTRKGGKPIEFERSKIIDLGEFTIGGDYWYDEHRGIVKANQEVDLGITITKDEKQYKVYFAKSNLTATGLAANESDFGDYFAWGAIEPWLTSYSYSGGSFSNLIWKEGKETGYKIENAPFYDSVNSTEGNTIYTKYTNENDVLLPEDDAASKILGGDWKTPTFEIWKALSDANTTTVSWGADGLQLEEKDGIQGMKIVKNGDTNTYIFLPAAGDFVSNECPNAGTNGHYWSCSIKSNTDVYYLYFNNGNVNYLNYYGRHCGFSIRPVRLEEID